SAVTKDAKCLVQEGSACNGIHADRRQRARQLREEQSMMSLPTAANRDDQRGRGDTMDLTIREKTAMVTDGTRGSGRAIVEAFLAEGADVAFCARSAQAVADTEL